MKRSPMPQKRATPRRNEGRITHARTKRKATAPPTAEEQEHIEIVASAGCVLCARPAEVHHVMHAPGKTRRRDHRFIVPLCPDHHRTGWGAVHVLGSEEAFKTTHGFDLVAWAINAWKHRGTDG